MGLITWLICAGLISVCATPVKAHDIYTRLQNKRGAYCCDGSEFASTTCPEKQGCVQGTVVLSGYPCRFFVVETNDSFVLVENKSVFTVIEGDRVIHPVAAAGVHEIVVVEQMTIVVEVVSIVPKQLAKSETFPRCIREPVPPLGGW